MMEEDEYGARRPRSRNWNTSEKFFLFEHVKNRFDIITDPRKETASINTKRRVWEQIYQAIAKEFGPLEEHLVRGKGGEKCRTQWKNLVQAARKEYKQYMEAKMVGKRHNMTLLSRKICRLMSIDLDDGLGDQDSEDNDWTEDHPEFRYQPELCQELKETARRINEEYQQGVYDTPLPMDDNPGDYEEEGSFEEVRSDSEAELPDDEKDEDYAPSARKTPRKRRRASSGRSSGKTPTRTSARAQAAQAKKLEEEKKAQKRKAAQQQEVYQSTGFQVANGSTLNEQTQQEILNLHLVEHKKRMNLMNTEHKTKMQNLKMEKDVMALQKEYWVKKIEMLYDSRSNKGRNIDEGEEDEEDGQEDDDEGDDDGGRVMDTAEPGPSGTSAPTSVVVPPPATVPPEQPTESIITPPSDGPAAPSINASAVHHDVSPPINQGNIQDRSTNGAMETVIPRAGSSEGYPTALNQEVVPPSQQLQ